MATMDKSSSSPSPGYLVPVHPDDVTLSDVHPDADCGIVLPPPEEGEHFPWARGGPCGVGKVPKWYHLYTAKRKMYLRDTPLCRNREVESSSYEEEETSSSYEEEESAEVPEKEPQKIPVDEEANPERSLYLSSYRSELPYSGGRHPCKKEVYLPGPMYAKELPLRTRTQIWRRLPDAPTFETLRYALPYDGAPLTPYRELALYWRKLHYWAKNLAHEEESDHLSLHERLSKGTLLDVRAIVTWEYLWQGALFRGAAFIEEYKQLYGRVLRNSLAIDRPQGSVVAKSLHHLFPIDHLIPWKEEVDDWAWRMVPISYKKEVVLNYRAFVWTELHTMFEDTRIELPSMEEGLYRVMGASSWDKDTGEIGPFAKIRKPNYDIEPALYGRRCRIVPSPGNGRDIIVLDWRSRLLVAWAEQTYRLLCTKFPECLIGVSGDVFRERLELFRKRTKGWVHYLRDYKKCGLTYNTKVFRVIGKLFHDMTGEEKFLTHVKMFSNQKIWDPESSEWKIPVRGYGLGLCNHLATIGMILTIRYLNQIVGKRARFICFNDDADIATPRLDLEYWEDYKRLEESLGNILNPQKEVITRVSLICENYNTLWDNGKQARQMCSLAEAEFTNNVDCLRYRLVNIIRDNSSIGSVRRRILEMAAGVGIRHLSQAQLDYPVELGGFQFLAWDTLCEHCRDIFCSKSFWGHACYCILRENAVLKGYRRVPHWEERQRFEGHIPKFIPTEISHSWEADVKLYQKWGKFVNGANNRLKKFLRYRHPVSREIIYDRYFTIGMLIPEMCNGIEHFPVSVNARLVGQGLPQSKYRVFNLCEAFGGKPPHGHRENLLFGDFSDRCPDYKVEDTDILFPRDPSFLQLPGHGVRILMGFRNRYGYLPCSLKKTIWTNAYRISDFVVPCQYDMPPRVCDETLFGGLPNELSWDLDEARKLHPDFSIRWPKPPKEPALAPIMLRPHSLEEEPQEDYDALMAALRRESLDRGGTAFVKRQEPCPGEEPVEPAPIPPPAEKQEEEDPDVLFERQRQAEIQAEDEQRRQFLLHLEEEEAARADARQLDVEEGEFDDYTGPVDLIDDLENLLNQGDPEDRLLFSDDEGDFIVEEEEDTPDSRSEEEDASEHEYRESDDG